MSYALIPAALAAITDVFAAYIVLSHQPDYPFPFLVYQVAMVGLSLLLATPFRWLWVVALLLLGLGVLTAMSVGLLYFPTVFAGGWVMTRRWRCCS